MWILVVGKRKVGRALSSPPILADANCTMVCIYMSIVLLISSLIYQFTGFGFVDSLGALGLIYFSINEGKEAFEKAAGLDDDCCGVDEHLTSNTGEEPKRFRFLSQLFRWVSGLCWWDFWL